MTNLSQFVLSDEFELTATCFMIHCADESKPFSVRLLVHREHCTAPT